MVVPYAHLDELQKLPTEAAHEMMAFSQRLEGVLRMLYRPDGINLGMNIGKAAVPEWLGISTCTFCRAGSQTPILSA